MPDKARMAAKIARAVRLVEVSQNPSMQKLPNTSWANQKIKTILLNSLAFEMFVGHGVRNVA